MFGIVLLVGLLFSSAVFAEEFKGAPIDWTGLYAGVVAGTAISDGTAQRTDYQGALLTLDVANGLFPDSIAAAPSGVVGGLTLGYNQQVGQFIGAVETDMMFTNTSIVNRFSRVDPNPVAPFTGVNTNTSYQTTFGAIATARARGGIVFDDTMIFVTAGIAAGTVKNKFTLDLPELAYSSPDWSVEGVRAGFTVGVGMEKRIGDNVGVKLELIGVDLSDQTIHAVDNVTFPGETIDYTFLNQVVIGRLGLFAIF